MAENKIENDDGPLNTKLIICIENGLKRKVPALHITWKDNRCFTKYAGFKMYGGFPVNDANLTLWLNETEWFVKDMKHLLELEYYRFWSTIVHNASALESIISFMQNALPSYLTSVLLSVENDQILPLYTSAHTYVFRVICRMTTPHESDTSWIEADFYGKLIYNHFIITVPFLFDLISIYGRDNAEKVSQIFESILKLQPDYKQDLKQGLSYLLNAMTVIQNKCESQSIEPTGSEADLNDAMLHVQDCTCLLVQLVSVSPSIRQICSELNFEFAISNFYDNALIVLYQNIQDADEQSSKLSSLNDIRVELLETFRSILSLQLDRILENVDDSLLAADKFINILTECLANNVFVDDYKKRYDIENDLNIVQLGYKSVDHIKYDFIQKAYTKEREVKQTNKKKAHPVIPEIESTKSNTINADQLKELDVQNIKELLPLVSVEKIREVLNSCENVDQAVIILLESCPAEMSAKVGQEEVIIPPDPLDEFYLRTGIDRLNIYDGDEFDVMVHDKVKGIIKKGKGMPGRPKTLNELLDDKSHINETRHVYRQFDLIDDDEYDDSFEAMTESESRAVKPAKGARNVLVDEAVDNDSDNESDNEGKTESQGSRNSALDFCENPELTRKRYEERMNRKYPHRQGNEAKDVDVRGKPKGQGQDSKVLLNRRHKNENKASSGNHNRKQGSSYKRNRGMLPS